MTDEHQAVRKVATQGVASLRMHVEHEQRRQRVSLPRFRDDAILSSLITRASGASGATGVVNPNPYALQPDTLDFLSGLLRLTTPRSIVEFGSGASTKVFASWAAENGAHVTSLEHDREWIDDIRRQLSAAERGLVNLVHAPLRPVWQGLRQFLTYRGLRDLVTTVRQASLFMVDGPHISGREAVLYLVLGHCEPGAVIVVDDFRHYAVFEMIARLPSQITDRFAGIAVNENSHGLFVLRCLEAVGEVRPPNADLKSIIKSYWRCLRDLRQHGTGD